MNAETKLDPVELIRKEEIGILMLNNPPRNELASHVLRRLKERLEEVKNDASIKAVILTGKGLFSTGACVQEIYEISKLNDPQKIRDLLREANDVVNAVENLGKLTVAAIERFCLGGGNELAMACHYRIAAENAKFGQPEIKLGIIPGMGGTQRLPRIAADHASAMRVLLTGDLISAKDAAQIRLVDHVVHDVELRKFSYQFTVGQLEGFSKNPVSRTSCVIDDASVERTFGESRLWELLNECSGLAAALVIVKAVRCGLTKPLPEALNIEQELFARFVTADSAQKGLEGYLIKTGVLKKEAPVVAQTRKEDGGKDKSDKTEELQMFRETARDFAKKEIAPKVDQMEEERRILPELIKQMAELGFYGVPFEEKYGGYGLGLTGYCVLMEELSRVHGSIAVMVGAHTSLACKSVYLFGNEDQKQRYLVPGIKGEKIGAYATTEPDVGSDVAGIKTSAKKVDGGWKLNGNKQFISNGAIANFVIVFAQTDPEGGNKTQAAFIVDTDSKGFQITKKTEEKIGLHASCTSAFAMDDLFVPDANLLGEVGQGFKIAMNVFNQSRISLGAGCIGAVKAARDQAIDFAKNRKIGGEPLWMKQLTQASLGEIEATIYTLESLVYNTARLYDSGKTDIRKEAAIVKYVTAEEAWKVIDTALQLHGGSGYIEDSSIARIWRDMRVNRIFEGTSEVQLLLIAKEVLKEALM